MWPFKRKDKASALLGMSGQALHVNPAGDDRATIDRHMMRNARIRQRLSELDPVKDAERIKRLEAELHLREAALGVRGLSAEAAAKAGR